MNKTLNWVRQGYNWMLRLYPRNFRLVFGEEMRAVFAQLTSDAASQGRLRLVAVALREVCDWPWRVLSEHWLHLLEEIDRRNQMETTNKKTVWQIEEQRAAIWAALPPVVLGLGILLKALLAWPVYHAVPEWRLYAAVGVYGLASIVLMVVGALAVIRRLPDWGFSWAGSGLMSFTLALQMLADERIEKGATGLISATADQGLVVVIFLMGLALLVAATRRGWQQAGLVSIGYAITAGLNLLNAATYAPFNRNDLSLLAGVVGLIMGAMIYAYARGREWTRIVVLAGIWLINLGASFLINSATRLAERDQPGLLVPLLVMLTGLLLAGPLLGALGATVRRRRARA